MQVLNLKRKQINLNQYVRRYAGEQDYELLIDEPTIIMEGGEVKIIYDTPELPKEEIVKALKQVHFVKQKRSKGLLSQSRVFGFTPRISFKNPFCSAARLARENPRAHQIINNYGRLLSDVYKQRNPTLYSRHELMTKQQIKPEYQLQGTPFTSGIVNKDNQLKYHFDTGNFKEVYSAMVVFKHNVLGGHLSLPEYGIGLKLRDKSVLLFDGQGILHGVTPIHKTSSDGYRYSIVYYSMQQIWKCLTITEELARIRRLKTEREQKRHSRNISKLREEFKK